MFERKKPSGKLLSLPIDQIHPSPFQARKSFDEQELTALAQSIRENGLLQPVTVRRAAEGYELVAGERRLRACQLAKMTTISAILCSYADDRTAALGLLENIQRADLNPFEQAQGLRDVMVLWDCTQAEAAKRLGMAQPTFANKLRLLQLTADQRQFVLDNNLTERHARAVLRLPENRRSEALITIAKRRLNARQTDSYIEQLLNSPPKAGHRISMVRDVRIFVNTIDHAIRLMTDNGVPATAHREEKDGYIEYTVRIPTTAVNLSSCVAALGKKVLIVDLDPQGNTTTGYGIPKRSVEAGTYEVLIGRATAAQAIRHTEYRTDVIGSNTRLAGASLEMIDLPGREGRLRKALAEVQKDYDFIFIDCPPSLDLLTLNGLSACDSVLIPVQCEYYALEGLSELISTLKTIRKKYNPYLDIEGVVFTMFSLRYNLTVQVVEQVQKYFGSKVYKTTIPRSIRISEAPSYGQPINFYEPKGKGSEAYMDLAIEFVKHNRPQEPKKSRAKAAPAAEPAKNALED